MTAAAPSRGSWVLADTSLPRTFPNRGAVGVAVAASLDRVVVVADGEDIGVVGAVVVRIEVGVTLGPRIPT
ncbi:MAG: hypothetical protein OEY99_09055 [Aigarchaeota archaeon]|nr:hypothetical protein [Aigarchaeota archaeon]